LIGVSGCGAADTPPGAQLIRDTLPGGVFLPRYASLPPPVAGPVAADLRIGMLEGEPHEVFGDVRAIEVDEDGTIYVLDHQASEVRAFDDRGRFWKPVRHSVKPPVFPSPARPRAWCASTRSGPIPRPARRTPSSSARSRAPATSR